MKIAMVAPRQNILGGPEKACLNIVQGLTELGIDVTLFAPGDWDVPYQHVPSIKQSLFKVPNYSSLSEMEQLMLKSATEMAVLPHAENFDIIHCHLLTAAYGVALHSGKPVVLTLHGQNPKGAVELAQSAGVHVVAISNFQKNALPISTVIGNSVTVKETPFSLHPKPYLVTVARIVHQKGIDRAIEIAQKAGKSLLIFGRKGTTPERLAYFKKVVEPHLSESIQYMGEVPHETLAKYVSEAEAFLFPIREPETFGLSAAEALAAGTPVIGSRIPPLPEIFTDERCAFLSDDLDQLVDAAQHTEHFDRLACRAFAEKHFDSKVVARQYLALYEKVIETR